MNEGELEECGLLGISMLLISRTNVYDVKHLWYKTRVW